MSKSDPPRDLHGLLAEFDTAEEILHAARRVTEAGYKKVDAFSPFPVEGLDHAVGFHRTRLPLLVLLGGVVGAIAGFSLQYWCSVEAYPLNIGGRPLNSWQAFIPITFEVTILFAALSAVFGMFVLNGLPLPYHSLFNVEAFSRASRDRFFLCVEKDDPLFDAHQTRAFLEQLKPLEVHDVPD